MAGDVSRSSLSLEMPRQARQGLKEKPPSPALGPCGPLARQRVATRTLHSCPRCPPRVLAPSHSPGREKAALGPLVSLCLHKAFTTAHGYEWKVGGDSESVGVPVLRQWWSVRTLSGEVIEEEGYGAGPGAARTSHDYLMVMFPMDHLVRMVRLTCSKLEVRGAQQTTAGAVL